jgi:hypothetical protein
MKKSDRYVIVAMITIAALLVGFFGGRYVERQDNLQSLERLASTIDPTEGGVSTEITVFPPKGRDYVTLRRKIVPIGGRYFDLAVALVDTDDQGRHVVYPQTIRIQPHGHAMGYLWSPPTQ